MVSNGGAQGFGSGGSREGGTPSAQEKGELPWSLWMEGTATGGVIRIQAPQKRVWENGDGANLLPTLNSEGRTSVSSLYLQTQQSPAHSRGSGIMCGTKGSTSREQVSPPRPHPSRPTRQGTDKKSSRSDGKWRVKRKSGGRWQDGVWGGVGGDGGLES